MLMDPAALRELIIQKAIEFGADDAGVCLVADLFEGPTHRQFPFPNDVDRHDCILVIAVAHPAGKPELDYYVKRESARFGNSEGNRKLIQISDLVGSWLKQERISSRDLHYYVERGGVFLKGAAVLAGLGTIGDNNLFIHPGYGPRIRLRAHLVQASIAPSSPLDFEPCKDCVKPCLEVCPANSLDDKGYHHDGCQEYMDKEAAESPIIPSDDGQGQREIRCCRICEFACSYEGTLE